MNATIYFELPLLIVIVSLVYSATRFEHWDQIWRETLRWVVRMVLFLAGIVLILAGLSLDEAHMAIRVLLCVLGIGVEVSLLFLK